jgi:precorrin-3B C17-methyltransferase
VLKSVDCVAGYGLYVDLIEPLIGDTPTLRSGMMKEVERVEAAIATATPTAESCREGSSTEAPA